MADPGYTELDAMVASLRGLGKALVVEAMPDMERELRRGTERAVSAQTDPYGKPWPATQDGEEALQATPAAIRYVTRGTTITMTLAGYRARHNRGWSAGGVKRQILPTPGLLPPPIARAFTRALTKRFDAATKGRA